MVKTVTNFINLLFMQDNSPPLEGCQVFLTGWLCDKNNPTQMKQGMMQVLLTGKVRLV